MSDEQGYDVSYVMKVCGDTSVSVETRQLRVLGMITILLINIEGRLRAAEPEMANE